MPFDAKGSWAKDLGYKTARVFLQYIVWKENPKEFKNRFEQFVSIAFKNGITTVPVLFGDCSFGEPLQLNPFLGKQRDPIEGMILPSWTPSPGQKLAADLNERDNLKKYVVDLISSYGKDKQILFWDLFNEPINITQSGTSDFLVEVFAWAREVRYEQPLTMSVWAEKLVDVNVVMLGYSDIISYHSYTDNASMQNIIKDYKRYNRPVICTEWMVRYFKSSFEKDLPLFKNEKIIAYQWGLVSGRTQCQFPWWNKKGESVEEKLAGLAIFYIPMENLIGKMKQILLSAFYMTIKFFQ